MFAAAQKCRRQRGAVLVLSMIFVLFFSALAVSLATVSQTNVQVASNQHQANEALHAALSGLECAKYTVSTVSLGQTKKNYVTDAEAEQVWADLCSHVQSLGLDGKTVGAAHRFGNRHGNGDRIAASQMRGGNAQTTFTMQFYRYDDNIRVIVAEAIGTSGDVSRSASVAMDITKDRDLLTYAMAGRGRMWLTGDTTIYGDIFSTWDNRSVAPFNSTSETRILGTVNTAIEKDELPYCSYDMETLDGNGNPLFYFGETVYDASGDPIGDTIGTIDSDLCLTDTSGNPVFDADGLRIAVDYNNRVYSSQDELQGYHENVKYYDPGEHCLDMSGLSINDYDTAEYYDRTIGNALEPQTETVTHTTHWGQTWTEEVPVTVTEYFPHGPDGYDDYKSGSLTLERCVYENQTITDAYLSANQNALFENCTFEGVLYVDCSQNSQTSGNCNNIRFNNCTFNGVVVTNTPQNLSWQRNALYFTGEATFNNTSDIQEATILAPHFNVDLGNTNPQQSDNNVLTGAIVGGIVDVRGNAQIYGTIVSMCDTSQWTSGFVTNIGATLEDGGSETTDLGDIGVISITPEADTMLPSGIYSDIVILPKQATYSETL